MHEEERTQGEKFKLLIGTAADGGKVHNWLIVMRISPVHLAAGDLSPHRREQK